jgi:4-aminobutyrate aminotransferase-like enzyme/Ser/Thr protein kinase RdoA (MazF antagonist)
MSLLHGAPALDLAAATRLARELYGVDGTASPLPSERDQNVRIDAGSAGIGAKVGGGAAIVLKIANIHETPAFLEAQQRAMDCLAAASVPVPAVLRRLDGATVGQVDGGGRQHLIWAVRCLPGRPLGTVHRRTAALLEDFGGRIGELSTALATFDHPAIHRDFHWDLCRARHVVAERRHLVDDPTLGAAIDALVAQFDRRVAPIVPRLRRSAVHGDLNDYNVLVDDAARDPWQRFQHISGIVDFGDMVHSIAIADLAIAAAYVMLETDDPLGTAAHLVRGYSARTRITDDELAAVFGLAALRLCVSACVAAEQRRARPDNDYLGVSQDAIGRTLPMLARVPFGLAEAVLRDACGLVPVPARARVIEWLRTTRSAPVLGVDLRREPSIVLDLSAGSPLIAGDARQNEEPALTARVFGAMREAGVRVAIGRYDEPRLLYTAAFFAGPAPDAERRTLHIGLDLFADAGTPVYAPLDGVVHAFADNHAPQDYGPVIILRHETGDGTPFFTLYGHLSRTSLDGLVVGRRVAAGERIATLGTPAENVGWTPHLHLQVITDLLDLGCDFPGVGRASQRTVWRALSPDPNLLAGVPADRFPPATPTKAEALAERRRHLGRSLSIAYRDPLRIVRGWMQWLFDDDGRRYLDAYNNVPHVGHAHPRVVAAGQRQMAVLNTNTRYLSDIVNEYAHRLVATLPPPLEVAFLVSSASEANELALRLARACTGRRDVIVLEGAYHGNTTGLIDVSPYKHAGPGGMGAPPWVHVAPLADDYRGPHRRGDPDAGAKYGAEVGRVIDAASAPIGAFLAETCPSVGGQIIFPPGYLQDVYRRVRAAGGICIADEVQTGLGRMGTHFWAFEAQDVVPDVVVIGKPLGNGHPLAAVVTTRAIADAFDNGMEYFSTFGGNTVSCAIGLAVLDVLAEEGVQAHALRVGRHMLDALHDFPSRHALVGDVRGSGLFLGVELVYDRSTLEPAAAEASYVSNRMREHGVLLGTDGPYHNVVKIRPPMPFDAADGERLVTTLDSVLAELA